MATLVLGFTSALILFHTIPSPQSAGAVDTLPTGIYGTGVANPYSPTNNNSINDVDDDDDDVMIQYPPVINNNDNKNNYNYIMNRRRNANSSILKIGYLTGFKRKLSIDPLYGRFGMRISGALTYAVDQVNSSPDVLPNHTLTFLWAETYGIESESIRKTALLLNEGIAVYIGPQETCTHEGRIAAAFNIPMISYFCTETSVSDKSLYPTFARTKPTDSQVSKSVVSLLRMFNWKKITFVQSDSNAFHVGDTIYSTLIQHGFTISFRKFFPEIYFHGHQINPFVKIVEDTYLETRIYVMLGRSFEFIGLMEHLHHRGLLDSGEYFVVGVCLDSYDSSSSRNILEGVFVSKASKKIALAFRHFVGLIHSPPVQPGYSHFTKLVDKYLEMPPFNATNPLKAYNLTRIQLPEAAFLYDAVWLYARVVDQMLRVGEDIMDGRAVISNMVNQTYTSAFGYLNKINSKGETGGNFSLIVCKETQDGYGMFPVGNFRLNFASDDIPTFEFYNNETIHWIAGKPPLDEPECGYHHERCVPPKTHTRQIAGGIAGGIILIGTIISYLLYRNWRYEQELTSLLWKIDYKDVTFGEQLNQGYSCQWTSKSSQIGRSPSQISLISQTEFDFRQLFTHVGTYRGTIVAIRRVNKRHVELTRNVRKELKAMRELRHDNINPFIGACIDSPSILIVTAYCTKGSLQDILENDDFQLDSMFIASLIHDIVRGMIYLHDSEIKWHGKLKSSNCVVDSRWVLKITDFGLHEFLQGAEDEHGEYAYYRNLLWRAPELLDSAESVMRGTQEGDVYSFAIILYEIYGRSGPYGNNTLPPAEIVKRVQARDADVPFRPRLSELGTTPKVVTDLIRECWDDDPHRRPDFKTIRSKLKPIQRGLKSSIFDNMLAMMEKYADNLEALVEERTDLLIEEKKKTEELLHEMLPRTVADQLMMGKRVEADTFDSVTIYFSDICGFTVMSSESTPMQVIDLLNDLYTLFDSTIEYYDVYKVETIGDAYMVVSGLPKTNGIIHAGEIASLSLQLLESIRKFKIRHRPDDTLKLRIGIHSGGCVAGVVGMKMPRYCLFGDTVNTASRMESTGEPLKIHCSSECKELLDKLGGYTLETRGMTRLKGKGDVMTYWLVDEDRELRPRKLKPVSSEHSQISAMSAGGTPGVGGGQGSGVGGSFRRARMAQCHKSKSVDRAAAGGDRSPVCGGYDKAVHYHQGQVLFHSPDSGQGQGQSQGQQLNGDVPFSPSSPLLNQPQSSTPAPPYLQPYGYLAGPSSQELLRRSSSRRRRFKFTVGGADEEELLKEDKEVRGEGVGAEAVKDTVETTPLIFRKHDMIGEDNANYASRCTSLI